MVRRLRFRTFRGVTDSVAHRVYKTLTTIVDDCASFVIHMPWCTFYLQPPLILLLKFNLTFLSQCIVSLVFVDNRCESLVNPVSNRISNAAECPEPKSSHIAFILFSASHSLCRS
jgi:hypothetical protein